MKSSDLVARLVINDSAMRNFFQRDGRNLRLKIENNMVFIKPTTYSRSDTIVITRDRMGYIGEITAANPLGGRFMPAIYSTGYRPSHPYFKLVAMDRKWIGLEHLTADPPDDGTEYLQLIAFDQGTLAYKRFMQTSRAVEQIKLNLPGLSEWDLLRIMPHAVALLDDIVKRQQRLLPIKNESSSEPLRPWPPGARVVTVEDVANVLRGVGSQRLNTPSSRPAKAVATLTDEMAEAIIFEAIGG